MKILVTGASGHVGSALLPFLRSGGHQVVRAVRGQARAADTVTWVPEKGLEASDGLDGVEAVVHLAGENIASRRWTRRQMERIRDSRVVATRRLCESLAALDRRPSVLACASAIGFYGDRGTDVLSETSGVGTGFLPQVCRAWEEATSPARAAGIRVVNLRFGVILDPKHGALAKMLTPFRMGAGGRIGGGQQIMSWISTTDAVRAIDHVLREETLDGPVNVVAPEPVSNARFARTLGRVLRRPSFLPLPSPMARLLIGRMADELLLASIDVRPQRLLETGFLFTHADLERALRALLETPAAQPVAAASQGG